MINRLILNETAYFYELNKKLTKKVITKLFQEVSSQKVGRNYVCNEVNRSYSTNQISITYSLCIFKLREHPSFLDKNNNEIEEKYAYLLIIEYANKLIISKKNVNNLNSTLEEYITEIDYSIIAKSFIDTNSSFEKISMANMDVSNLGIRKRNIEAVNLKESFSPIYASRYILNQFRIKKEDSKMTLNLNTSRINNHGTKIEFNNYINWIKKIVDTLNNFRAEDSYIDNFALPIDTQKELLHLKPASILFSFADILEREESSYSIYYKKNEDKIKCLNVIKFIDKFNTVFEIEQSIDSNQKEIYKVLNSLSNDLIIKKNKKTLNIHSKKLNRVFIKFDDTPEINILTYIRQVQNFIVTFTTADTVYTKKKIFKDHKLLNNINSFVSIFETHNELENINSEKGKNYSKNSSEFLKDSLFYFVENKLAYDHQYLFCDDLGNEFADFISINSNNIYYYHAKYANSNLSASDFHIVVAQALKNIGNMRFNESTAEKKKERWVEYFPNTAIPLLRRGDNVDNGITLLMDTLNHPQLTFHIYLVINYLSKSDLENELNKLKEGKKYKYQSIQLFWLLSSFVSTCRELGIQVHITSKK